MMRIFLFLATNIAVLLVASVTLSLLGVDRYTGQNHGDLLIFCAVFGFSGFDIVCSLLKKHHITFRFFHFKAFYFDFFSQFFLIQISIEFFLVFVFFLQKIRVSVYQQNSTYRIN